MLFQLQHFLINFFPPLFNIKCQQLPQASTPTHTHTRKHALKDIYELLKQKQIMPKVMQTTKQTTTAKAKVLSPTTSKQDYEVHRQKMIAAHAAAQKILGESDMTLEQRAFEWVYTEWLEVDGPANCEGNELDYSPEHEMVAEYCNTAEEAGNRPFATMKELLKAIEYLVESNILYHAHDQNKFNLEWAETDGWVQFLIKHLNDTRLRKFCEDFDDHGIAEDIMAEKGWEDEDD